MCDSQLGVDVVGEVEELLLAVGLAGRVGGQETLRTLTAARLPDPLDTQPANTAGGTAHVLASNRFPTVTMCHNALITMNSWC